MIVHGDSHNRFWVQKRIGRLKISTEVRMLTNKNNWYLNSLYHLEDGDFTWFQMVQNGLTCLQMIQDAVTCILKAWVHVISVVKYSKYVKVLKNLLQDGDATTKYDRASNTSCSSPTMGMEATQHGIFQDRHGRQDKTDTISWHNHKSMKRLWVEAIVNVD